MNRSTFLVFVLLAAALACATLALASFSLGWIQTWSHSLSPLKATLLPQALLVFSALLAGLGVYVRRRRGQSSGEF